MKQILWMIAAGLLMGCGEKSPIVEIADPIVEKAIRYRLNKPTGELTKKDLGKVKTLGLGYSQISDAGLKEVAKLENLIQLDLRFTQITDVGLMEAAKLKNLTQLFLADTKVTKAGMSQLQKELPRCYIVGL